MSSLSLHYKSKDKNGTETTVKKRIWYRFQNCTSSQDITSAKLTMSMSLSFVMHLWRGNISRLLLFR